MTNPADTEEPAPTPGKADIWPLVVGDMIVRDMMGRERYGTRLQSHNGRRPLVDAYQEALDLAVYLRQAIAEADGVAFRDHDGEARPLVAATEAALVDVAKRWMDSAQEALSWRRKMGEATKVLAEIVALSESGANLAAIASVVDGARAQIRKPIEPRFVVQQTTMWSGDVAWWWAVNAEGYTIDLAKAGRWTHDELARLSLRPIDKVWPVEEVEAKAIRTVTELTLTDLG